jgi:hypothetical protein
VDADLAEVGAELVVDGIAAVLSVQEHVVKTGAMATATTATYRAGAT